jgi:hypothetical protein
METLRNAIQRTADTFANPNTEKNLTGVEESKDPAKELERRILESLGLDPKKMGVEVDKELQEALKRYIETLEKNGDKIDGATKLSTIKENEEGAKGQEVAKDQEVTKDRNTGKEVEVSKALSRVLSESRKVSNEGVQGQEQRQRAGSFLERVIQERQNSKSNSIGGSIGGRG